MGYLLLYYMKIRTTRVNPFVILVYLWLFLSFFSYAKAFFKPKAQIPKGRKSPFCWFTGDSLQ
jgi:hypothetical protein